MRKATGIVLILLWLLSSGALWATQLGHTLMPPGTGAVALNVSQAVLLAYRLSTLLSTLLAAYVSVALAGLLSGLWLLGDGLMHRARLLTGFGATVVALEAALGLFAWLRLALLLGAHSPTGPITNVTVASGELASLLIPCVLLLGLSLGAILLSAPFSRPLAQELVGSASLGKPRVVAPPGHDAAPSAPGTAPDPGNGPASGTPPEEPVHDGEATP